MLADAPLPSAATPSRPVGRLSSTRDAKTGEWIEIQAAAPGDSPNGSTLSHFRAGSLYLPLDAMTLIHPVFSRAEPGFAMFSPQLFDASALGRLRAELIVFRNEWTAVATAKAARARYEHSSLVRALGSDEAWREAQGALTRTIDDLSAMILELSRKGHGAWIVATQ